jgi:hypothetical protein
VLGHGVSFALEMSLLRSGMREMGRSVHCDAQLPQEPREAAV